MKRYKKPKGKLSIGVLQDVGQRDDQQDSFGIMGRSCGKTGTLAIVADGMGGLVNSAQVSQTVVGTMLDAYAPGVGMPAWQQLLLLLKLAVSKTAAMAEGRNYQSGTTVVACLLEDGGLSWVSCGDSRLYLLRNGGLIQLTRDHDFAHDLTLLALRGEMPLEEPLTNARREALTSFVGMDCPRHMDYNPEPLRLCRNDRILLVSDGIYRALEQPELEKLLRKSPKRAAKAIGKRIRRKKLPNQDNYTALILKVH